MGANKRHDKMLMSPGEGNETGYGSLNGNSAQPHLARLEMLQHAQKRLIIATMLCLVVMIAEIVGGYIANSLAIMSDAAHMLADFLGFVIALLAICLGRKHPSESLTHGWYRAEIIGALISVMTIWIMTGVLIYFGIKRTMTPHPDIDATVMIITASTGLTVNLILACILHARCDGSRSTCSSTHASSTKHDNHQNVNLQAATLHVIGDIIQSFSILVGAIVLYFRPDLTMIDPILTIIFSVIVFMTTCRLSRDIILILMEAKPSSIDFAEVRRLLVQIDGVEGAHSLRIWSLTTGVHVITVHLVIDSALDTLIIVMVLIPLDIPLHELRPKVRGSAILPCSIVETLFVFIRPSLIKGCSGTGKSDGAHFKIYIDMICKMMEVGELHSTDDNQ